MTAERRAWAPRRCGCVLAGAILAAGGPGPLLAQSADLNDDPLSAIDWLSDNMGRSAPFDGIAAGPEARTGGLIDEEIEVRPLGEIESEVVGLFPAEQVGLPRDFWGHTPADELAAQLRALRVDTLPAAQTMIYRLLLAEFDPAPAGPTGTEGDLMLARIDTLKGFGALEQALQLIESGTRLSPELWQRWFDIALLLGEEDRACAALNGQPDLSPAYAARVFCLARGGDWSAAALTLQTAESLGGMSDTDAVLLRRFLDPEDADIPASRFTPPIESPLHWRILEAIGEPVYTHALPVAYAQADLRGTAGWRAQIEAAERLTRSGALEPNRLLGLYTEARAAASGGIWDRVRAVTVFERALETGTPEAIGPALLDLWHQAQAAELETAFAALFTERLEGVALTGPARMRAFEMALLAPEVGAAILAGPPSDLPTGPRAAFLAGLAQGRADPELAARQQNRQLALAIAVGMADDAEVPASMAAAIAEGATGQATLGALERLAEGAAGDLRAAADALATLRALGLEATARRAALELMILTRAG